MDNFDTVYKQLNEEKKRVEKVKLLDLKVVIKLMKKMEAQGTLTPELEIIFKGYILFKEISSARMVKKNDKGFYDFV